MLCVAEAAFVGVYVTAQLLLLAVGEPRVQVVLLKPPAPELAKVMVPAGADCPVVPEASVTVAVQVVPTPASTVLGLQATVVVELRLLTLTAKVPLLVACELSPP